MSHRGGGLRGPPVDADGDPDGCIGAAVNDYGDDTDSTDLEEHYYEDGQNWQPEAAHAPPLPTACGLEYSRRHLRDSAATKLAVARRVEYLKATKWPNGTWRDNVGTNYATAMALLVLQIPYRYLPIFQD